MFASLCVCLQVCVCVCECVCARTSCASLPVLLSHGEDLLHPVVHRFSKPAELVALLLPAQTHTHTHTFVRPPSSTPPPGPLLTAWEPSLLTLRWGPGQGPRALWWRRSSPPLSRPSPLFSSPSSSPTTPSTPSARQGGCSLAMGELTHDPKTQHANAIDKHDRQRHAGDESESGEATASTFLQTPLR